MLVCHRCNKEIDGGGYEGMWGIFFCVLHMIDCGYSYENAILSLKEQVPVIDKVDQKRNTVLQPDMLARLKERFR